MDDQGIGSSAGHGPEGLLTTKQAILGFICAGDARFTFRSKRTGRHFTYRVRKAPARSTSARGGQTWFVEVLTGGDNTTDYRYAGTLFTVRNGMTGLWDLRFRHGGSKAKIAECSPSWQAFVAAMAFVVGSKPLPPSLEVWHEGRCGRCGRTLTRPESVATGLGPVCAAA